MIKGGIQRIAFFDLIIAIEVGTILSSFIILKRMSESVSVQSATEFGPEVENGEKLFEDELLETPGRRCSV